MQQGLAVAFTCEALRGYAKKSTVYHIRRYYNKYNSVPVRSSQKGRRAKLSLRQLRILQLLTPTRFFTSTRSPHVCVLVLGKMCTRRLCVVGPVADWVTLEEEGQLPPNSLVVVE